MTEEEKELIKKLEIIGRAAQIHNVLYHNNIPIDELTPAALRLCAAQLDSIIQIGLEKAADALRNGDEAEMNKIGIKVAKDTKEHVDFETMKVPEKGRGH